jgi:hypothetical protein
MKGSLIGGGLLAAVGAGVLAVSLISSNASPRGWISSHYARTGTADVFRADRAPSLVAGAISREFKPLDRAYDPAGAFLRYPTVMVAVLPDGRGSRIELMPVDRGYRHYHSYVGGRWGGVGGRASSFRGGGPGSGK